MAVPAKVIEAIRSFAASGVDALVTDDGEFYGWGTSEAIEQARVQGVRVYYLDPETRTIKTFGPPPVPARPAPPPPPETWADFELELAKRYLRTIGGYSEGEVNRAGSRHDIIQQARGLRPPFPGDADWPHIAEILVELKRRGAVDAKTAIKPSVINYYWKNMGPTAGVVSQYGSGARGYTYAINEDGLLALELMPFAPTAGMFTKQSASEILAEKARRAGTAAKPEAERRADLQRFLAELTPDQLAEVQGELETTIETRARKPRAKAKTKPPGEPGYWIARRESKPLISIPANTVERLLATPKGQHANYRGDHVYAIFFVPKTMARDAKEAKWRVSHGWGILKWEFGRGRRED